MALSRIRKDDMVMVIAGKERGKTGKVLRVLHDRGRVLVEQLNVVKRHQKPRGMQAPGGIVQKEASLHLSNVQPVCAKCNKPSRVGVKRSPAGAGVRVCRRCGAELGSV